MEKIKKVTTYNNLGASVMEVGKNEVVKITDDSLEFDTSLHIQYNGWNKDGKLIRSMINGNLDVEYFHE